MSEEFFSRFPAEHLAAMASAASRPGASVSTDASGTTITGPRTFTPSPLLNPKTPSNLVQPGSPLSKLLFSTYAKPGEKVVLKGTIPVFVDGSCKNNGMPTAKAGMGVFFGPGSPHNISTGIGGGAQTSQRAEILASIRALEDFSKIVESDMSINKVVLITDSAYVVRAMSDWVFDWKENGWKTAKGEPVVNRKEFEKLDALIDEMQYDAGIDVEFWLVGREHNTDADALARAACEN